MGTDVKNFSEIKNITIKDKEHYLFDQKFIKKGSIDKFPHGHVSFLQNNVYGVYRDKFDLSYFCEENGEAILNIRGLRKLQFVDTGEAIIGSGFFEKKEGEIYRLYKILGFDENDKPVLDKTPIDPYSKEYYNARMDIDFNRVLLDKALYKKNLTKDFSQEELEQEQKNILSDIDTGAITIDTLEILHEQGKLKDDFFSLAIKKIVKEKLLLQCTDERLDKVKQGITREKIDYYIKKGYISPQMADNCKKVIELKEVRKKVR